MITQERLRKEPISSSPRKSDMTPSSDDNFSEGADPAQVAEYLADLLEGTRSLASKAGLTFLAYLIQVAVEEAKIQAAQNRSSAL